MSIVLPPTLLVTRPQPQADAWVLALQGQGLRAAALPLIEIAEPRDAAIVAQAWRDLPRTGFVMFVSGSAVQRFFAARPPDAAWPQAVRAGATGPGTAQALRDAGVPEDAIVMPAIAGDDASWDAEALWRRIASWPWAGREVMVVRGEGGRDWLAQQWRDAGAAVRFVEAYRRVLPQWQAAQRATLAEALQRPQAHVWLFSSSEALGHLRQLAPSAASWAASRAWATHARIASAARAAGFGAVAIVAPTLDAVARALREGRAGALDGPPFVQSSAPPTPS